MDSDSETCTPPEITAIANTASECLLPSKSVDIYEATYQKFMLWRNKNKVNSFSENVMLSYMAELAKDYKSSTLWSNYSMLKSTINIKQGIDIGKYPKLRAYLKRQHERYVPKKSLVLEKEHVFNFMKEAPDEKFLLTKVSSKIIYIHLTDIKLQYNLFFIFSLYCYLVLLERLEETKFTSYRLVT